MNAEAMLEVLKRDFGINNREEFEAACKNFTGLDIGIFITPVGEVTKNDGKCRESYLQTVNW